MKCFRCSDELAIVVAHPEELENAVTFHGCQSCQGIFIAEEHALHVCPLVAGLRKHAIELLVIHKTLKCPSCQADRATQGKADPSMKAFKFAGMEIDVCVNCWGVWLDPQEHTNQLRGLDERELKKLGGTPYRTAEGDHVPFAGQVPCARCEQRTETVRSYMTPEGLMCVACYQNIDPNTTSEHDVSWFQRVWVALADALHEQKPATG